jgi:HMG (high mobility group) box
LDVPDMEGGRGDREPARNRSQHFASSGRSGDDQKLDDVGDPLTIEEMQIRQWRQQLLGNIAYNSPLSGTGNFTGGSSSSNIAGMGMTPSTSTLQNQWMSNIPLHDDHTQTFSSPALSLSLQLQQQRQSVASRFAAMQQQQQQQVGVPSFLYQVTSTAPSTANISQNTNMHGGSIQSLPHPSLPMDQQVLPRPDTAFVPTSQKQRSSNDATKQQQDLEHLQQLQKAQRQIQQQQQLSIMNISQQGFPYSSTSSNAASFFPGGQLQVDAYSQQQQQLMANNSLFDTPFNNTLQAQMMGASAGNPDSASGTTFNQMMGMMPRGMASSSAMTNLSTGQPSSLFSTPAAVSNSASLNQSPFSADPSSFLGKIPGQDISLPSGQSMSDNLSDLARLGDNLSSLNFNAGLLGLPTPSDMNLSAQVYPRGMMGAPTSSITGASMRDTMAQRFKIPASTSSSSSSKRGKGSTVLKPLSAYNYFFTEERDRILHGDDQYGNETNDARKLRLLSMHLSKDRNQRRPHRKTHGKISFTTLSKHIGQKWRKLNVEEKNFYKSVAKADMARYKEEAAKLDRSESQDSTVAAIAAAPTSANAAASLRVKSEDDDDSTA